jgi:hypothetical protein
MGRVPLILAATFAVAVILLLYAGVRWGWPFILIGLLWFVANRMQAHHQGRRRRRT